jgi:hypothetical protein
MVYLNLVSTYLCPAFRVVEESNQHAIFQSSDASVS